MNNYHIKEDEEQLRIHWRYLTGSLLLPTVLMIAIIVLLGYCWADVGMMVIEKAIHNPHHGTLFPAAFIFFVCAILAGVIVFLLFYQESLVLNCEGLTLEKRVLWLAKERHILLGDLQPFDYFWFNRRNRTTYFIRIVAATGEFRFGMGWDKSEMQAVCQSLNRYLENWCD